MRQCEGLQASLVFARKIFTLSVLKKCKMFVKFLSTFDEVMAYLIYLQLNETFLLLGNGFEQCRDLRHFSIHGTPWCDEECIKAHIIQWLLILLARRFYCGLAAIAGPPNHMCRVQLLQYLVAFSFSWKYLISMEKDEIITWIGKCNYGKHSGVCIQQMFWGRPVLM